MSLPEPGQHPAYVFRTAGGLYLTTQHEWGKVTALRSGRVPAIVQLRDHGPELQVEIGITLTDPPFRVREPVALDEVRPGMQSLTFQSPHPRDWVRTSDIITTYAGVLVSSFRPGKPHLVMSRGQAWHIDAAGTTGRRFDEHGWDGTAQPVNAQQLLHSFPEPRIFRIAETATLEGWVAFAEHSPGWVPFAERLHTGLAQLGGVLHAIYRDPATTYQPLVRASGLDRTNSAGAAAFIALVEEFWEAIRVHCQRCGALDPNVRLMHFFVSEVRSFRALCTACTKEEVGHVIE